jgi:hypothetical protein
VFSIGLGIIYKSGASQFGRAKGDGQPQSQSNADADRENWKYDIVE